MRITHLSMQLAGLLVVGLALAVPAHAGRLKTIKYALDNKDGKMAVFTCRQVTDGQCFLKIGAGKDAAPQSMTVKAGESVQIPVSDAADALCYSADPDVGWPGCLEGTMRLDLSRKRSTSGSQSYFGETRAETRK